MGLLKALGIEKEADAVSLSKEADLRAQAWRKALDEASREDAPLLAESWAKEGEKIVALLDPVGKNRWAWALARAMHDSDKAPDLVCAALWAASSAFPPQSALKKSAAEMLLRMFWASAEWRAVWPGRRAEGFDFMRGGAGALGSFQ